MMRKYMNSRRRFALKAMAMFLLVTFVGQIIHPTAALALTGGPSQPEISQFQQVSASDMVDLFSGDFGYNIPLFEVPGPNGGYPFNLSYQSAPSMDQEASWVGLGWNINPGSIVRNMRGLPDDFNGQKIKRELDMKPNITAGIGVDVNYEIFSADFQEGQSTGVTVGLGLRIYYNNYKGVGYTVQPGVSFNLTNSSPKYAVGLGFNFSLDSQDGGIGANLDMSVATNSQRWRNTGNGGKFQAGIGYNTNSGINASYSLSLSSKKKGGASPIGTFMIDKNFGFHGGSTISFAHPTVSPSIGTEMTGGSFTGGATLGFDPSQTGSNHLYVGFSAFVDVSEIANKYENLPSFGYLNYDKKNDETALVDYNRDKDVVVKEQSTPNLHNPILTYDYYMVNGQGTGGMFRPYRQEVGYIHEQSRKSGSGGGSLGFNIPLDGKKIGINVGFNFSDARSGRWDENQNGVSKNIGDPYSSEFEKFRGKQFSDTPEDLAYEGPYFKMNGSMSTINTSNFDDIGGEEAVRFNIDHHTNVATRVLKNESVGLSSSLNTNILKERRPRGQEITPIYNNLLFQGDNTAESMAEMQIKFYSSPANLGFYNTNPTEHSYDLREPTADGNSKDSHIGGFIVTNADGNRYVYGLPAYNNTTKEHIYTAIPDQYGVCQTHKKNIPMNSDGTVHYKFLNDISDPDDKKYDITDQFKSITTTPAYTHSHLLTSVLGTDYVDSDGEPGPSDNDYGYWVKFSYVKTNNNFNWRTPFDGASYQAGSEASYEDDKINFTYGQKEIWYIATVETKTHIAVFEISERKDGKGAAQEFNSPVQGSTIDNSNEGKLYKLDKIKLYAKSEYKSNLASSTPELAIPIQTIHFEYDYSLCPGVPNNNKASQKNKDVLGNDINTGQVNNDGNINAGVDDPNSSNPQDKLYGKLTLKAVYFTYKTDNTGKNHKYKFGYANNKQYEYTSNRYDRWGTYNWYTNNGECQNAKFPFTNQFAQHPFPTINLWNYTPSTDYDTQKFHFTTETNEAAAAWCLNKIELPSGGSINVEYESDDYAYVQHREATQMFKITSFGYGDDPTNPGAPENDWLYPIPPDISNPNTSTADNCNRGRKVYFRLEKPIKADLDPVLVYKQIYTDYIHPLKRGDKYQVFLNARVNLKGGVWEDIESYYNLDIDPNAINSLMNSTTSYPLDGYDSGTNSYAHTNDCITNVSPFELPFGVCRKTTDLIVDGASSTPHFTHGYIILDNSQIDNFDATAADKFNPISVNAWYYMKENLPKILYTVADLDPGSDDYERIIRGGSLLSIFPQMAAMFRGFPAFCYNDQLAYRVDLNKSWVKLASPDGIKYGGGCRVKQLYMQDDSQWAQDNQTDIIGQVYDYTIQESKYNEITKATITKTVSSGVAAYEPIIGGEENALHYAKFYKKNLPLKSANQTFYEGPVDEAYFPAPQVGYRKVTVSSLPTNNLRNMPSGGDPALNGIRATGITIHEFYTAKEFPSIVHETDLFIEPYIEAIVPIPFIGTVTDKQIVASQGYVIKLNDMHGKQKSTTSFGIKPNGVISDVPTSSVEYLYKSKPIVYEERNVFDLDNSVQILVDDPNMRGEILAGDNPAVNGYEANTQTAILGMDYEFFYDMRQSYVKAGQGGLDFNLDLMGFGIFECPVPLPWPSYSQSYAKVNTIVANKIIHKAGILETVKATDGQSVVSTQNLVFDPITGGALLTSVNNNFNEPVYNYSIPGRFMFDGMDGAYKNSLFEFSAKNDITPNSSDRTITISSSTYLRNSVYPYNILVPHQITLANILAFLHEGDEFIVEPQSGSEAKTRVYLLTPVSSSQLNCDNSAPAITALKFYVAGTGTLPATPDVEYKFTLVRSGYRNLLANNVGSIVSLNTGTTPFLVNPNDPNPPSILDIINHSPIKNRVKEDLASSSSTFSYTNDLKDWLNSILEPLPFPSNDNELPLGIYSNSMLASYPLLADKIEYIIIGNSTTASESGGCLTCPEYMNEDGPLPSGYSITIKIKSEFGGGCIYEPCIARKFQMVGSTLKSVDLVNFSTYVDNSCTITAHYYTDDNGAPFTNYTVANPSSKSYTFTCYDCPTLNLNPFVFKIKNILQASSYQPLDIWGALTSDMYAAGNKGIWRPSINYYYKDERYQDYTQTVHLNGDGVFAGIGEINHNKDKMFYLFDWLASAGHPIPEKWILNNKITQYNINGVAIETKDILDIYNATIFDRNTNLPVAIADNTKKQEILAYNFDNSDMPSQVVSPDYSFTGKKSLKVASDLVLTLNFNDDFKLEENKSYVVSAWTGGYNMTKSPKQIDQDHPTMMNIKIEFTGPGTSVQFKPSGLIFEGTGGSYWRRLEGSFTVPVGTTGMKVTFTQRSSAYTSLYNEADNKAYFDDIRLHPAKSIMKTFVYDEIDFKLKAELDENNYPMYYGYDGSGQLTVVKVLTENGIKTIKEAFSNTKRN